MVYGGNRIMLTELKPDLSGIRPGGVNKVIIESVNALFGADQGLLRDTREPNYLLLPYRLALLKPAPAYGQ